MSDYRVTFTDDDISGKGTYEKTTIHFPEHFSHADVQKGLKELSKKYGNCWTMRNHAHYMNQQEES